jgi:hypothetical protein
MTLLRDLCSKRAFFAPLSGRCNEYGGTALDTCQWGSLNFRDRNGDYSACAETLLRGGAKLYYPHFGSDAVQAVLHRYSHRAS